MTTAPTDAWDDDRQLAVAHALGRIESHIDRAKAGALPPPVALAEIEHTLRALYDRLGMQWHSQTDAHRPSRG